MSEEEAKGKIEKSKGKIREEAGKMKGSKRGQTKGKVEHVKGKIEEEAGSARPINLFSHLNGSIIDFQQPARAKRQISIESRIIG